MNEVGFAWQLQRGGRRRQLRARDQKKRGKAGDGESASSQEENCEEPCILPGEVLIGGGGAFAPLSPPSRSPPKDWTLDKNSACSKAEAPSQPTCQTPESPNLQHASLMTSRPATAGIQVFEAASPGGSQSLAPPKDEVLNYMLARSVLMQNMHNFRNPTAAASSAMQALRAIGNHSNAVVPRNSPLPLLSQTAARMNSVLPILSPQSTSLLTLPTASPSTVSAVGASGEMTNSWRRLSVAGTAVPTAAPLTALFANSLLDPRVNGAGMELSELRNREENACMLPEDRGNINQLQ